MAKICITGLTLLSLTMAAQANDTAVGGSGASPYPVEQPNIKMVAEKIIITGQDLNKENMRGAWDYDCSFVFKNTLNQPISLQMGFPFPINDKETMVAIPAGQHSKPGDALVYNFTARANNKLLPVKRQKITANIEKDLFYRDAYIWKFTFSPLETVAIKHNYETGATFDVMGFHFVSYVLKTGKLWQGGRIGRTEIEVIPNTPTRLCSEVNKDAQYTKPKPKGIKIIGKGKNRRYVWNLKNFAPTEDLSLCLQTGKNYIRYRVIYPLLQEDLSRLHAMTKEQLALIRNTIYAQYGRVFDTPKLQAYFKRQWWYEPNAHYSDNLLTPEDQKLLSVIKQLEAKKT
ncbi:Uncharacterised protein [Legionella beliardensis]|uniref:YARHG domain-containing protein n=1 Tax=Legionella beliardensis TaxID=91822 RepID=A0A378I1Q1_9GAMM|nr:YARHG domain-containing protein [Legionella beliardensis]STX28605.1 Uncharacterised protein [Legionella beliardensis]